LINYNPFDHYWINEDTQEVFSSRRQIRVGYNDAEYVAWLVLGNVPTRDPGDEELRAVLAAYRLGLSPAETANFTKNQAKAALVDAADPTRTSTRNSMRVIMASLVETRAKINELVDKTNGVTTTPIAKLPVRTWQQILAVAKQYIDAETDPSAG
jgi:hypothetical protein